MTVLEPIKSTVTPFDSRKLTGMERRLHKRKPLQHFFIGFH
jgi:hypothetical protein